MENTLQTAAPNSVLLFIQQTAQQTARRVLYNKRFAADDEDVAQRVLIKIVPRLVPVPCVRSSTNDQNAWTVREGGGLHPNFLAYVRRCALNEALSLLRIERRAQNGNRQLIAEEVSTSLDELLSLRSALRALKPMERQLLVASACGELQGSSPRVRKALSRARRKARDLGAEIA